MLPRIIADTDVLIENFRTGTMERWGIGWEDLRAINPKLVMVRVTGFGQTGPYRHRPGFGTVAEAFSGFAAITGEADGPPTLPNFGLADGIAAAYGTSVREIVVMNNLRSPDRIRPGQQLQVPGAAPFECQALARPVQTDATGFAHAVEASRRSEPAAMRSRRSLRVSAAWSTNSRVPASGVVFVRNASRWVAASAS